MAYHEITCRFLRERNVFISDDGETRVIIAEAELLDGGRITLKGEAKEGAFKFGLVYRLWGKTVEHWKHGDQFEFDCYTIDTPAGKEAVCAYLQQLPGIGPKSASKLYDVYLDDAVRVLRETPEEAVQHLRMTPEESHTCAMILRNWQKFERAKIDLIGILAGRGLPKSTVDKAIARYGVLAAATIRHNPYVLMAFKGCGFSKTDRLYLEFGHNPARRKRQALCLWHAIATQSEGHTWYPDAIARGALYEKIAGAEVRFQPALDLALRAGMVERRVDICGRHWISERRKAWSEERSAKYLVEAEAEHLSDGSTWPSLAAVEEIVHPHQFEQLSVACGGSRVGLLTGGPGTGKTHTAAALLAEAIREFGDHLVAACAPTGKAAVRMNEAAQKYKLPVKCVTIHSLLGVASSADGWEFQFNRQKRLPYQFILVDEASMIDADLCASLLSARARGACVLFLGDPNQLAPVGHGAPLRDMIVAGIPCGELTEIQRNSGRIVTACDQIRRKRPFDVSPKIQLPHENLPLIECSTPGEQITSLRNAILKIAGGGKFDAIWDVQVLTATNKKSELSRVPLNKMLQECLNPDGQRAAGSPFRVGDKVINRKNGWIPSLDRFGEGVNPKGLVYVANGEQGEAIAVEPRRTLIRLQNPDRTVVVPRGGKAAVDDEAGDDSGEEKPSTGCNWELGYALSVHNSQGSEWPLGFVILDEHGAARRVCSRQWLATAISRFKVCCFLVGKHETALAMLHRDSLFERKTFLVERISEQRGQALFSVDDLLEGVGDLVGAQ